MAQAMQGALATGVVWNGQQCFQDAQNLGIEFRALRQFRTRDGRKHVPPQVARAVERICSLFV